MTAQTPVGLIQTNFYQRLTADDDLPDIYDHVTEGTPKPYVVVGEAYETPRNSHSEHGRRTVHTIHVWSDHRGYSEATGICDDIIALLDHQPMTIVGFRTVSVRFEFLQLAPDPDPDIRHALIRFVVTTEQLP